MKTVFIDAGLAFAGNQARKLNVRDKPVNETLWRILEAKHRDFVALSDRIWETPELSFQEHRSASEHAAALSSEGFRVARGIAGLPTAVLGEAGSNGPVVAIMGEYDALAGLSQEAGIAEYRPLELNGNGHGCGHNLLGSASLLAATSVKDYLQTTGISGRIRYLGCPAEESGSGKTFMVRAGVFDDVDAAICWHPSAFTGVTKATSLACAEYDFEFHGRAAHASTSPHLGRSALDAVELMNVGVNYMREHMPPGARVHYAMVNGGGISSNVVQAAATVRHLIRATTLSELSALVSWVNDIAQGAALMTGTKVTTRQLSGDANLIGNSVLEEAMAQNLRAVGPPQFDEQDRSFAKAIRNTLTPEDIEAAYRRFGMEPRVDEPLSSKVSETQLGSETQTGSTDVGSVSWVVPTVQCRVATYAIGTPGHSWQLVAQGKAPAAHKGMVTAAKAMAATALDLLTDATLLFSARATHEAFRARHPFVNPLSDINPALDVAAR